MRFLIQLKLKFLAKLVLKKYKPEIIGITGSVGKTSTKEAVYRVLKKKFKVRRNRKNYNNEIGVPLTILGVSSANGSLSGWVKVFWKAFMLLIFNQKYPEILILELAIDRPGDMKYLMSFVPVDVGIVTAIGEFPVHLEFFPEKDKLIEEKKKLLSSLPKDGMAIMNYDDLSVRDMGRDLSADKLYYGFGEGSDLQIFNFNFWIESLKEKNLGINFKIDYQGNLIPVKLEKILGKQSAYAATAAIAVGLFFGMNLVEASSALLSFRPVVGRANLIKGVKNTWIIDDTYNASPASASAALEILDELGDYPDKEDRARRKIAVLGDMLELGRETETAHRRIGEKASEVVDLLITVGTRARFIANEAIQNGFSEKKITQFLVSDEAGIPLQNKIKKGDIVLVKGSRSMHMEKIVKEIMAKPRKSDKLLVQ